MQILPERLTGNIQSTAAYVLVVDLDGTLTPTDTLWESLIRMVRQSPLKLLLLPLWLSGSRAAFKAKVADAIDWRGEDIPLNAELIAYLQEQKRNGRRLVLATAANARIAETVAARVGLFDAVIADGGAKNLKGAEKLAAIQQREGLDFVYAGDSRADMPVWQAARAAIVVGASDGIRREVAAKVSIEREFPGPRRGVGTWLRAIRIHQWIKNSLLFVPLLTSFTLFNPGQFASATLAFFAFCAMASASYLANDLLDLDHDRAHPRKHLRPLASAAIAIPQALLVASVLAALSLMLGIFVGAGFVWLLLAYALLTALYTWQLKRHFVADVLVLACLYTLRILAGAVAIGVALSSWLLAFSAFLFFGLALVKRCAELVALEEMGRTHSEGRNYQVRDLRILWPLGVGASLCSVVVFGLFISSPEVAARYASPHLIWFAALGLIYWLSRLWIKTGRGEMHDDPLVYALRDRASRLTVLAMILVTLAAYFFRFAI
ncbi:MAG: UbiA family prenyltransferase [Betaproteobacteria bacterium]|nr:UbiA family prenyltransferase [Betaproteobacteria bacterium]